MAVHKVPPVDMPKDPPRVRRFPMRPNDDPSRHELRRGGLDGITIRDLLLMSTGIKFVQDEDLNNLQELWPFRDVSLAYSYPNLRSLVLPLPPSNEPVGAAFNYNPYYPILLRLILERTTHRPVAQYLQEKIWQPLGMEYSASWSLDGEHDGFEKMTSGLNARAIDFAKFGWLFLDNGNWNGKQIVSKEWVTASTAPDPNDHRRFLHTRTGRREAATTSTCGGACPPQAVATTTPPSAISDNGSPSSPRTA